LKQVLAQSPCLALGAGRFRQTDIEQGTFFAGGFENRWRHFAAGEQLMQFGDRRLSPCPEFRGEFNVAPPFAVRVKDGASRDGIAKHFLQTQRLRAKLSVVILPLPPPTELELDRKK